jgi:hypothetical protein
VQSSQATARRVPMTVRIRNRLSQFQCHWERFTFAAVSFPLSVTVCKKKRYSHVRQASYSRLLEVPQREKARAALLKTHASPATRLA